MSREKPTPSRGVGQVYFWDLSDAGIDLNIKLCYGISPDLDLLWQIGGGVDP